LRDQLQSAHQFHRKSTKSSPFATKSSFAAQIRPFLGCAMRGVSIAVLFAATTLLATKAASAAVTVTPVVTVSSPVFVTNMGDKRLFLVELGGRIKIFDRNTSTLLATPFLDINSKISTGGERGLFSMAFHPDYATNGFFYVNYTNTAGNTVIERYHASSNPNVADPASAATLLVIPQPFANHNGGQLQIGRNDGYLYIGMGDGGDGGDPNCNAQRKDSLLGKMLRLDVRQNLNQAPFYGIPADNPFRANNDPSNQIPDEVWAFGLRNPWRFSFDRNTGDLYIGDVGENQFEEVDLHSAASPGGQNFGWNAMEGMHCFVGGGACPSGTPPCNAAQLTLPIVEHSHAAGDCAIIGGYVSRGPGVPELSGHYVYSDYCTGDVRILVGSQPQSVANVGFGVTSFGEDSDGNLYLTVGNDVRKLGSTSPVPVGGWAALFALASALGFTGTKMARSRSKRQKL
jgi:glucose/arabinose dehydrogenase